MRKDGEGVPSGGGTRKMTNQNLVRSLSLGAPGIKHAVEHIKGLRPEKLDKRTVFIVSFQKAGSTLLSYIASLVNTNNQIEVFRNDFDLVPMLSFPTNLIAQNFNARQDGKYQLYKINGSLRKIHYAISELSTPVKTLWSTREFFGYFQSVYWWLTSFYPRIGFSELADLRFNEYEEIALEAMAKDHVAELRYVFDWLESGPDSELFMGITYEAVINSKPSSIVGLARWMDISLERSQIAAIVEKTSKNAMAKGNRFDPVSFGDYEGLSKVNSVPHTTVVSDWSRERYSELFESAFAGTGITNFLEFASYISDKRHGD